MKILCIPMDKIRPFLSPGKDVYTGEIALEILSLLNKHGTWAERAPAEEDPSLRQVIPYVTIQNPSIGKRLLMTRMKKQGEARLHGKEYIGVGGHIEQEDGQAADLSIVPKAASREIKEETGFEHVGTKFLGVICIDGPNANMVDRVHLGIVYDATTSQEQFVTEEADQHNHRWVTDAEIRMAHDQAEAWTQLTIRELLKPV